MPPLVTPFVDGAVDLGTSASLVDRHAEEGSHGVVVCSESNRGIRSSVAHRAPSTGCSSGGRLVDLFVEIAAPTEIPVLVHTCRHRETVDVDRGMITEVALFAPNFVGLVQSSADLGSVTKALITFGRDFRILAGSGSFAMMALGAHGAVDSIAKRTALRRPTHAVTSRVDALLDTLAAC